MRSPSLEVLKQAMRRRGVAWCPENLVIQGLTGEACGGQRADGVALREFRKDVDWIKGQCKGGFSMLLYVDVCKVLLGCKDVILSVQGLVLVALEGSRAGVTVISKDELGGEARGLIHNSVANLLLRVLGHKDVDIDGQWSTSIFPHGAEVHADGALPLRYIIAAEAAVLCCGHVCKDRAAVAQRMHVADSSNRGFAYATSAMYLDDRECSGELSLEDYFRYHDNMCELLKGWDDDIFTFLQSGNPGTFFIKVFPNRRYAPVPHPIDSAKIRRLLIGLLTGQGDGELVDARVAKSGKGVAGMGYMRKVLRGGVVSDMLGVRKRKNRRRDRRRGRKKGCTVRNSEQEFADACVTSSQ